MALGAIRHTIRPFQCIRIPSFHYINQRAFSATPVFLKSAAFIPTFPDHTSNPELDAILTKVRTELFIPEFLPKRYRQLANRKKYHKELLNDPIEVDLPDGEKYMLVPKECEEVVPRTYFTKALNAMNSVDMDVIPGLIRGFDAVGRPLGPAHLEMMVRKVMIAGRIDVLMVVAREAGRNGLFFTVPLARMFMRTLRVQSKQPDRDVALVGVKNTEQLLNIFGEDRAKLDDAKVKNDISVVGTALEIQADVNIRFNEGKDYEEKTLALAKRLKKWWEADSKAVLEQKFELGEEYGAAKKLEGRIRNAVLDFTPVLEGLEHSKSVLGEDWQTWLREASADTGKVLARWKDELETLQKTHLGGARNVLTIERYDGVAQKLAQQREEAEKQEAKQETENF